MTDSSEHSPSLTAALLKIAALHKDADGIADVVAVGARAIPALECVLLERDPSGLHQVRCRAVEALGLLGAFDILEKFLQRPAAGDPVERLGDEVVVSAAARAIARRKDEPTFHLLCDLAMRYPLNGVIGALGSFERPEAIPVLISALGEDEARSAAEVALAFLGTAARPALFEAIDRFSSNNRRSESQLRYCRSVLSLLGNLKHCPDDVDRLWPFITSADVQMSLLACRIALRNATPNKRLVARARLLDLRRRVPWLERLQIDQYLASGAD